LQIKTADATKLLPELAKKIEAAHELIKLMCGLFFHLRRRLSQAASCIAKYGLRFDKRRGLVSHLYADLEKALVIVKGDCKGVSNEGVIRIIERIIANWANHVRQIIETYRKTGISH